MLVTGIVESTDAAANALPGGEERGFGVCTTGDGCSAFGGTGSTCQHCGHGFSLHSNFAATIAPTEPTTEPTNASVGSAANGFGACTLCDCPAFKGTGSRCQTRHCHHKFSVHGDVTDPEPTNAPVATGFGVCNCGCPTFVGNGSTCQNCGHGFSQHSMFAAATEVTK
jgi:hypothetical protein